MHHPVAPGAFRGPAAVVNEGLLHPNGPRAMADGAVLPSGLPVPLKRRPVGPRPISVLLVQRTEEVPLQVPSLHL